MAAAGMLLTGGSSRRMGRDKAAIRLAPPGNETMAERTARLLDRVTARAVEVGPGQSHLLAVTEDPPGGGPLAAVAAGWAALSGQGWSGLVLVVATDLPLLTEAVLRWLVDHPAPGSVVPVVGGRVQPLCARYSPPDLEEAARLVRRGSRAMMDLLGAVDALLVPSSEWGGAADVFSDVDTPSELQQVRRRLVAPLEADG
jgi:molybdopterin-guanine dinucleotide biosynthesis protein A